MSSVMRVTAVTSMSLVPPLICLLSVLLLLFSVDIPHMVQAGVTESFGGCNDTFEDVHQITSAMLQYSVLSTSTNNKSECLYAFKTPSMFNGFLVKLIELSSPGCRSNLTVVDLDSSGQLTDKVSSISCSNLSLPLFWYSGPAVLIRWQTPPIKNNYDSHFGFGLLLTAVTRRSSSCESLSQYKCSDGDCVSHDLRCDEVSHCLHGDDETECPNTVTETVTTAISVEMPTRKTTTTPISMLPPPTFPLPEDESDLYLWMPLIVVVIFTCVMVTVILLGRRYIDTHGYHRAGSLNHEDSGEVSTNPAYVDVDGMPRTPPPSYTDLARQISYVSYISVRSDELSIPPGYEEACELPGTAADRGRRRFRHRSAGGSVGSSMNRGRSRPRIFSRSLSEQDAPRRISSDSMLDTPSRPRFRIASEDDDSSVFMEPPLSATVIHEHPQWEAAANEAQVAPSGEQGSTDCDSDSQLLSPTSPVPVSVSSNAAPVETTASTDDVFEQSETHENSRVSFVM